ncbi:MAG: ribonuclease P protein component [Actinomycetes bacterium]
MLPAEARLRRSEDYMATVRRGRRAGGRTLVVHMLHEAGGTDVTGATVRPPVARVGFVVSRAVGNAVTRNRVRRRLRHLVRDRLDQLPRGAMVAVRALPPAADATATQLGADLDAALARVVGAYGGGRPAPAGGSQ